MTTPAPGPDDRPCPQCKGTRTEERVSYGLHSVSTLTIPCGLCGGVGSIAAEPLPPASDPLTPGEREAVVDLSHLFAVVRDVHGQHADDLCWMDIDRIFAAAGLSVPDRSVGDKTAMLTNCRRFIDTMCSGGKWESYADLERRLATAEGGRDDLLAALNFKPGPVAEIHLSEARGLRPAMVEARQRASEAEAKLIVLSSSEEGDDETIWRCFHCDEVFTSRKYAAEHFGAEEGDVPACRLSHSEGHLITYIRKLQRELASYRREDNLVLRAWDARVMEGVDAVRRAEETGYNRGVQDAKKMFEEEYAAGTKP